MTGPSDSDAGLEAVREVLEEARDLGFLGPGPIETHVEHARGFVRAWDLVGARQEPSLAASRSPQECVDMGAGGGVPGLVLGTIWPDTRLLLVETMRRRASFLSRAVTRLGMANARVFAGRAEELGRDPGARSAHELVVARGFGPPAVTAECSAPLLRTGGLLIVSEPPEESGDRWPPASLVQLGLTQLAPLSAGAKYAAFRQTTPCPDRFPRRPGIPAKRPLF